jgi:carboxypeptidase C (cathepsin A)
MRSRTAALLLLLVAAACAPGAAPAAAAPAPAAAAPAEPLPPEAHVRQSTRVGGRTLRYTVTVGSLPVKDEQGRTTGEVVFTAYTVDGKDRPVTFAVNGGPGASSVYLNFGAIGPKHVRFGNEGDSASATPRLEDNPGTWLDFTDLVFIDPVGTGFSRALVPKDQAKKDFYSTEADIEYLSRVIYDWLVKNRRLGSSKYLVGESYGGFRGPRITHYLQTRLGVGVSGLVLISPYLNPTLDDNPDVSPMHWVVTLPSIAAAELERGHRLTPQAMAPVIDYARGDYATALMKGRSDPAATAAMVRRVAALTGLDPAFVTRSGGRIEPAAYLREIYRGQGRVGSYYDSNVTAWDPFPYAAEGRGEDPILEGVIAPLTTAMVDFMTRTVGWPVHARYYALNYDITMGKAWDVDAPLRAGSSGELREALAADPRLRVLIAHGWNDLTCPFMGSVLTVDQMPAMGDPARIQVKEYPGGHMFYSRAENQADFRRDVRELYERR